MQPCAMASGTEVRAGRADDMAAVAEIYAHYVRGSVATFEFEPPDASEMRRRYLAARDNDFPYLVAEYDGHILGFAYAAAYRARPAYRWTVEDSVYLKSGATAQRLGTRLLRRLVDECRERGIKQMIAVIGGGLENAASVRLHARCGFREVGVLAEVGCKFGRWIDTLLMQRAL